MKRNSLLALSLIYLVSASTFAAQYTNGMLFSHKEWGASNIKMSFSEMKSNNNRFAVLINQVKFPEPVDHDQIIDADTKINDVTVAPVGGDTSFKGEIAVFIYNRTSDAQIFSIKHETCLMQVSDDGNTSTFAPCSYSSDSVFVDSHKFYSVWGNSVVHWAAPKAGRYGMVFVTSVQNFDNKVLFRSTDYSDIVVPEAEKKS